MRIGLELRKWIKDSILRHDRLVNEHKVDGEYEALNALFAFAPNYNGNAMLYLLADLEEVEKQRDAAVSALEGVIERVLSGAETICPDIRCPHECRPTFAECAECLIKAELDRREAEDESDDGPHWDCCPFGSSDDCNDCDVPEDKRHYAHKTHGGEL